MSTAMTERSAATRTADPLPPNSFALADLPRLTFGYLQSVEVRVKRVTGKLVPGDEGSFTVRVTNGALRLTDWTLHLFSSDADVATIKAEPGVVVQYRLSGDRDAATVPPDSTHAELFAFFLQGVDAEPTTSWSRTKCVSCGSATSPRAPAGPSSPPTCTAPSTSIRCSRAATAATGSHPSR